MNSEAWLDKAERLRSELARLQGAEGIEASTPVPEDREARERVAIARWLRTEFSDEAPDDTNTLALFPETAFRA
jgi:hypothetical protein